MRVAMAMIALAGLAACGQGGGTATGNQTAAEVADELSDARIEPGQWEATSEIVEVSAPGMPAELAAGMKGQKTSLKNCVTPEQAAKPDANFLTAQKDSNCTYRDFAMRGGRMTGTMTCTPPGQQASVTMTLDGRYAATSYDMEMRMTTSGDGAAGGMTMTSRTSGRRIGDCA